MSILSLSTENKDKLLQLIESLEEIFEKKDNLTQRAEPFVKRMNEITIEKEKLNEKTQKYDVTNFKSVTDASELSDLIVKSKQLDEEIENINDSSKTLNVEFDAIINQENEIISKIEELFKMATKNQVEEFKSILIEKLGINVFVIKPTIPDVISVVDRNANEIINCQSDIVKSLSDIYFENSIEITKKVDRDDFKVLEKYFLDSKAQKEQSIDERLSFLQKDSNENKEEKAVVEQPKVEITVENNITEEPVENKEEEKTEVVQENTSNILSLDSILEQEDKVETNKVVDSNIIIIRDRFDNSNSKVANSNKTKIENIKNNFKGTFVLPIIKSEIEPMVEVKPMDPITSFINPKAA